MIDYITPEKIATHKTGMTLRDYFAAKAMQGFLSATKYPIQSADWYTFCDGISEQSYDIADAMLEARKDQS